MAELIIDDMAAMASDSEVNFVYNELLNFFPQIDPRILKAVAIENHDNIDEAFCVVIDDILPNVLELNCLDENMPSQCASGSEDSGLHNPFAGPELQLVQEAIATLARNELAPEHDGAPVTPVSDSDLTVMKFFDEVSKIKNSDELISVGKGLAHHLNIVPEQFNGITSVHEKLGGAFEIVSSNKEQSYSALIANVESILPPSVAPVSASFVLPEVTNLVPGERKSLKEVLDCEPDTDSYMAISGDERDDQVEQNSNSDELQQDESATDWFDASANDIASLPRQTISIELLESSIEEARNNKKNLFSSMEAVMNTMREVEIREKTAEKVKEVASKGGAEILARAEDLRTMLLKAKETNDMHAGEVYGERSILATEGKELQSRLANLSEERDEALCILDEMRSSLEVRLAAADIEIRNAEEEILQKENAAKMHLDEQEAIMEKIVQESKLLQLEADENSKLREFLVDRGRIVDTLHGEIGVICQDVKSLKARFDQRVPLSESFSSGETTCILVSSASSSKKGLSSLVIPDPQVPSESTSPSKSPTEMDDGSWEFLAHA